MVDAVRDRLPDRHVRARQAAEAAPQLRQQLLARPLGLAQADVDLRRLDALHVLVEFGAAGAPRGGDDLGLRQQDLLDAACRSRSDLSSDVPGSVFTLIVRLPSWNSGRNAVPNRVIASAGGDQQQQRDRRHQHRAIERDTAVPRANARLERPRDPPSWPRSIECGARQERVAERRRHDDGDAERCEQRDDVGVGERRQQPAFDAGQAEDRQEHQHDDDRREDDRRAGFRASHRARRPPRAGAAPPAAPRSRAAAAPRSRRR